MATPTDAARFSVFSILIGIAIGLAIQEIFREVETLSFVVAGNGLAFLLFAILFYHGKVVTTESSSHSESLKGRPGVALIDYILNFLVVSTFVIMPHFLDDTVKFLVTHIAMRLIDLTLVLFTMNKISSKMKQNDLENRAQISWAIFDFGSTIVFFLFVLLLTKWPDSVDLLEQYIVTCVVLIAVADILMDYLVNRKFYASQAGRG